MTISKEDILIKLEQSKKAVLKRIAKDLQNAESSDVANAGHSSHSSGTGKGHTSYVGVALRLK